MKIASLYRYHLTGSNSISLAAGEQVLSMSFEWPVVYQEQYDLLTRRLKELPSNDPLLDGTTYNRTYDYLEYYNNVPELGAGMEEWLEEQTVLPASLRDKESSLQLSLLQERKELCEGLTDYKQSLEDMLHWHVRITDSDSNTVVTDIIPGGWFNNQDLNWAIRFTSDLDTINQDQISLVTVEVEVYDLTGTA